MLNCTWEDGRLLFKWIIPFFCIVCTFFSSVCGLGEDGIAKRCKYKVHFRSLVESYTICLDKFTPLDDSCALVKISAGVFPGTHFNFRYTLERTWLYEGITYDRPHTKNRFAEKIINDESGTFLELIISINQDIDSLVKSKIDLPQNQDVKIIDDTLPREFPISIGQYNFICEDRVIRGVTVIREYTYPAGYMRRGQELNYPELKMFHYGKAVRMPKYTYLKDIEGLLYYHIQHYNNNAKFE